jgi:hypothetical protein
MKLTYRGVSYEYEPIAVATETGKFGGKYRGRDWRFRNLKKPPILMPVGDLTYRGVKYSRTSDGMATVTTPPTSNKARLLLAQRNKADKQRQQSLLSRTAAELVFA